MITLLQTYQALPAPRLFPSYRRRWLPKKDRRASFFPSFCGCTAPCRFFVLSARSSMDRHVDIRMDRPDQHPFPHVSVQGLQHSLNVSSRWIVVAVVLAVLILRHDDQVLWAFTGSILNSASSKLLKKMFNQERPLTALGLKADPGMPSSHAQSFGYLGLYAAYGVILWKGLNILGAACASSVFLCCIYLAWLRFVQGLHTRSQVVVGVGFGSLTAAIWIALWHYFVRDLLVSSIIYHYLLVGLFGSSAFCFLAFGVRKWRIGEA